MTKFASRKTTKTCFILRKSKQNKSIHHKYQLDRSIQKRTNLIGNKLE